MSTLNVLDSGGLTVAIEKPLTPGRANAALSRPVVLSNEDFLALTNTNALVNAVAPVNAQLIGGVDSTGKIQALGLSIFHNADNQVLGSTQQGLITGGVTQLVNATGNLDRVREGYADAMPITGFAGQITMVWNGTTYDRNRAASGDALAATGISAASDVLWNNTSYDRPRSAYADGIATTGIAAESEMLYNGATFDRARSVTGDAQAGIGLGADVDMLWNGTTYDRPRAAYADAVPTTGVPGESELLWNGSAFDRARSAYADGLATTGVGADADMLWNGTTFDRPRSALAAQATTGIGIAADAAFGVYQVTAPTLSTGQFSAVQIDFQGNLKQSCATGFVDSIVALGISATFTGTARVAVQAYAYFNVFAFADQAGTLYVDISLDSGSTWQQINTVALIANAGVYLRTPVVGAGVAGVQYRARVINGATALTIFRIASSYAVA